MKKYYIKLNSFRANILTIYYAKIWLYLPCVSDNIRAQIKFRSA